MDFEVVQAWFIAHAATLGRIVLAFGASVLVGQLAGGLVARSLRATPIAASAPLARRVVVWGIFGVGVAMIARELGFDLSLLLGAAGILSVAVGFASQTSASNVISGVFLLAERPFLPGDLIRIGTTTGEVLSIDLLSIKLRTFDNLYVRLPNETVMKSEITNLTRFPIRRFDIPIRIAWVNDSEAVRALLIDEAEREPLVLNEPKPSLLFLGWGEAGLELQLSVWSTTENYVEMRNRFTLGVQRRLASEGIQLGVPHRRLVTPTQENP